MTQWTDEALLAAVEQTNRFFAKVQLFDTPTPFDPTKVYDRWVCARFTERMDMLFGRDWDRRLPLSVDVCMTLAAAQANTDVMGPGDSA